MSIDRFINHPQYQPERPGKYPFNDLSLVKLAKPLDIASNPDLGMICVPPQDDTYNPYQGGGQMVTAIGWGMTNSSDIYSSPDTLRKITVPVADMDWCKKMHNLSEGANTMICTFQLGKGTCEVNLSVLEKFYLWF